MDLQFWLGSKAVDYPALRHLRQTYGLPSTEVPPTQQDSKSLPNAEAKQQSTGDHDQDRGVDGGALKRIRGCFLSTTPSCMLQGTPDHL